VERCRIVLLSAEGWDNEAQAADLGIDRQCAPLAPSVGQGETSLGRRRETGRIRQGSREAHHWDPDRHDRCGAPPKFTPEQIAGIIALACERPSQSGAPVSHWTPPELAREAIKRGIVESISPRQVDLF
jgi:hypothetical protein